MAGATLLLQPLDYINMQPYTNNVKTVVLIIDTPSSLYNATVPYNATIAHNVDYTYSLVDTEMLLRFQLYIFSSKISCSKLGQLDESIMPSHVEIIAVVDLRLVTEDKIITGRHDWRLHPLPQIDLLCL